jgi:hypothetical protein
MPNSGFTPNPDHTPAFRDWVSALAMIGIIVGCALEGLIHLPGTGHALKLATGGSLALFVAVEMGRAQRGAKLIALACLALAVVLPIADDRAQDMVTSALSGAADLAAFFAALGFLHMAAKTSPLIQRCGGVMVRQPPSRRYLALTLGAHLISLVLSFGVLNLLGLMVAQGNTLEAAGGDAEIVAIRKARMMSALLRGFIAMVIWSPLSVSFAVIHRVIDGLSWSTLIPIQMVFSAAVVAIGWVVDRKSYPPRAIPAPLAPSEPGGNAALFRLGVVIAVLMAGVLAVAQGLGAAPIVGIICVIPLSSFIWLVVQNQDMEAGVFYHAAKTLGLRLGVGLPEHRNEVIYLGGAMFLGLIATQLLGQGAAAHLIAHIPLSPLALTIILPWTVMALAQLGVPQIFSITVLGGAFPQLAPLGVHPLALASGLMGAWALSAGSTPVGAAVVTIARQAEVPVRMVTLQWNGVFVLVSALFLGLWVAGVSWIFG